MRNTATSVDTSVLLTWLPFLSLHDYLTQAVADGATIEEVRSDVDSECEAMEERGLLPERMRQNRHAGRFINVEWGKVHAYLAARTQAAAAEAVGEVAE